MNAAEVIADLERATAAAFALARSLAAESDARAADGDDWTRMPKKGERSAEGMSRSTIERLQQSGKVRRKTVGGLSYYSAADARRVISNL